MCFLLGWGQFGMLHAMCIGAGAEGAGVPHLQGTRRRCWCDPLTRCLSHVRCSSLRLQCGRFGDIFCGARQRQRSAHTCLWALAKDCPNSLLRMQSVRSYRCNRFKPVLTIVHWNLSDGGVFCLIRWILCILGCNTCERCWV